MILACVKLTYKLASAIKKYDNQVKEISKFLKRIVLGNEHTDRLPLLKEVSHVLL